MTDPLSLRAEARTLAVAADRSFVLADQIDQRRRLLVERVEPARRAHRPEVWSSRAGEVSRDRLNRHIVPALWSVAADLGAIATRLRDSAADLDGQARALLIEATELEATELEATELEATELEATELEATGIEASGPTASIGADALDAPLGAEVPAALDR